MKTRTILLTLLLSFSSIPQLSYAQEKLNQNNAISIEQIKPQEQENYEYDFGSVEVGTAAAAYFTITNNTKGKLTFKSGAIAGDYFSGEHNCAAGLKPKEQCDVAIYYYPETAGDHVGAFEMAFDPNLLIHVDLFGNGY